MQSETLNAIAEAFEFRSDRDKETVWLSKGFTRLLEIVESFEDTNCETLWACALLLTVIKRGGSCLLLENIPSLDLTQRLPQEMQSLTADQWREKLSGDVFGDGDHHARPLVLRHDRLYFDRMFRLERDIARRLATPLGVDALVKPADWEKCVADIFPSAGDSDLQRNAVMSLFDHRLMVLSGGPGTGKTFTVAKMLVALHLSTDGRASFKICAPTAKAAQRIKISLKLALAGTDTDLAASIMEKVAPSTIHKLLKISPLRARRRQTDPLHADFVIVDETSMVDLALIDELLRSLSDNTRLILVGDPNQLQSIDVGSVMTDLVQAMKFGLPGITLNVVHRVLHNQGMNEDSRQRLLALFEAIRTGNIEDVMAILGVIGDAIQHVGINADGSLGEGGIEAVAKVHERAQQLVRVAQAGLGTEASEGELKARRDELLESVMVLSAQHRGTLSREWWVNEVATKLGYRMGASPNFIGLPILVTATDYGNGISNGDTGLIVEGSDQRPIYVASHQTDTSVSEDAEARRLPSSAVHDWQPWWAMTIHKSQGSEFDHVIVSITPETRLLSRELLYTALTRARSRITLIGTESDIRKAIGIHAQRYSGLAEQFQSVMLSEKESLEPC
jgi:exodeoxyribonuclease V alpha subunit